MLLLTREDEKLAQGRAEGIAQGRLYERLDIARQMRQRGLDDNFIHETTNLSLEEIKNI